MNRRAFLTGLLASAAAISAGPIVKVISKYDPKFHAYTSHSKWTIPSNVISDWRYVVRMANVNMEAT